MLQVVFNTVWLVPLRLLLLVLPSVAVGIIVSGLASVGDRLDEDNPHPLRGWRRSGGGGRKGSLVVPPLLAHP